MYLNVPKHHYIVVQKPMFPKMEIHPYFTKLTIYIYIMYITFNSFILQYIWKTV